VPEEARCRGAMGRLRILIELAGAELLKDGAFSVREYFANVF
jgi:hypothetical protein